jgi:hypothetical protein
LLCCSASIVIARTVSGLPVDVETRHRLFAIIRSLVIISWDSIVIVCAPFAEGRKLHIPGRLAATFSACSCQSLCPAGLCHPRTAPTLPIASSLPRSLAVWAVTPPCLRFSSRITFYKLHVTPLLSVKLDRLHPFRRRGDRPQGAGEVGEDDERPSRSVRNRDKSPGWLNRIRRSASSHKRSRSPSLQPDSSQIRQREPLPPRNTTEIEQEQLPNEPTTDAPLKTRSSSKRLSSFFPRISHSTHHTPLPTQSAPSATKIEPDISALLQIPPVPQIGENNSIVLHTSDFSLNNQDDTISMSRDPSSLIFAPWLLYPYYIRRQELNGTQMLRWPTRALITLLTLLLHLQS